MIGRLQFHRLRRLHWVWHLVLAVGVLLGQAAVARHNLQHALQVDQDAVHAVCAQCLALHAMDHVGPATPAPTLPPTTLRETTRPVMVASPLRGATPAPYWSRGPPSHPA
ncbi:MAG: hypothetical protein RI907_3543 [Pseudomonadota bacterium]|jgi:hypothetical protein